MAAIQDWAQLVVNHFFLIKKRLSKILFWIKLNAPPPNDNFQLTRDFFDSLSPSDAKDLFNQLNTFSNLSQQFDDLANNKISAENAQTQLNDASRKTLAAALGVSPSDINVVGPNNPADPNKIDYDPSLKGREGTAGAAKLDGKPKSIVIGPDAVKLDNPLDTIDTVAHEASHVRLAADRNKLLEQWQNLKGKKDDFQSGSSRSSNRKRSRLRCW